MPSADADAWTQNATVPLRPPSVYVLACEPLRFMSQAATAKG
jgi:hypothetical protein